MIALYLALLLQSVAVQVVGSAEVKDGNVAAARAVALDDALRQAVEQALGAVLDEATRKKAQKAINRRVLKNPRPFIPVYRVLDEKNEAGKVELLVEAQVSTRSLLKELDDLVPRGVAPPEVRPAIEVRGEGAALISEALAKNGFEIAHKGQRAALVAQPSVSVKEVGVVRGTGVHVLRAVAHVVLTDKPEAGSTPSVLTELDVQAVGWGNDPVEVNRSVVARALGRVPPALGARIAARFPVTTGKGSQILVEGTWEWSDFLAIRAAASGAARADAPPLAFDQTHFVLGLPPGAAPQTIADALTRGTYPAGHSVKVSRMGSDIRVKISREFEGGDPASAPAPGQDPVKGEPKP